MPEIEYAPGNVLNSKGKNAKCAAFILTNPENLWWVKLKHIVYIINISKTLLNQVRYNIKNLIM